VFPLFLLLISKVKFINKVLLLFVGMTLVKIALSDSVDMNFYRTGTLFRLDSILLGFMGAHFKDRIVQYPKLVVIAIVALFSVFLYVQEAMFLGQIDNVGKILFVALLQSISFFLLFGFILADGNIKNNHLKKFCGVVANQTYSIYLFHLLFLYIIKANFISVEGIFIYYLAALFIVSYAVFEYFEKPLLSLRPRYK
jgi:peptidoglycan/LPS O-acetylase OafA/YrhL